jgi:hypothetical protein
MSQPATLRSRLDRLQRIVMLAGAAGLVLCGVGAVLNPAQFFRSYLLAYLFWLGLTLGCLAILMVHYLAGGTWGAILRRALESGMRTLPLMALLFVPLLFGLRELYSWARPEVVAGDEILRRKSAYLNLPFFAVRLAVYFLAWLTVAYLINRWSRQHEQAAEWATRDASARRLALFSGVGLVIYSVTMTFAAVDWVMSLEPHWYSTIYGIVFLVGQLLGAMSFAVVVTAMLAEEDEPLLGVMTPEHLHDIGNLLITSVLFWAYIAFSQFVIMWSGNLPEEIRWYVHRTQGGWEWIGVAIVLFQFAVPFVLLLSQDIKRHVRRLAIIAAVILFMHLVDLFWTVMPAFYRQGLALHWLDVVAVIGVGGVWLAIFVWQLKGRALLPLHDPSLQGAAEHE